MNTIPESPRVLYYLKLYLNEAIRKEVPLAYKVKCARLLTAIEQFEQEEPITALADDEG